MKRYCSGCRKFVDSGDGRCPVCGTGNGVHLSDIGFISGDHEEPLRDRAILPPDTVLLDRFSITRLIARGRFTDVYLARDTYREEDVALKVAEVTDDDEQVAARQLVHEAQVSANVRDHSHVVKMYDVHCVRHDGTDLVLLAMEYADGGNLRQWLVEHRDAPDVRRRYALEYGLHICRGIDSVHNANIVLGDVKPENLVFIGNRLCVADFGAAIQDDGFLGYEPFAHYFAPRRYSTPHYMSPEMFQATHPDEIDVRANVYSMGVILFEMLHRKCRLPFYGDFDRLAILHASETVPPLTGVPEELEAVVLKCLAKPPHERYQTVGELGAALEGVACEERSLREEPAPMEVLGEVTAEVDPTQGMWRQACAASDAKDFSRVGQLCDEILSETPDHQHAIEMKDEIDQLFTHVQEMYEEAAQSDGRLSLIRKVELVRQAAELYPNHPCSAPVLDVLEERVERYGSLVHDGYTAVAELDWDSAHQLFAHAATLGGEGAAVLQSRNVVHQVLGHRDSVRRSIDRAVERRDQNEACRLAQALDRQLSQWASDITQEFRRTEGMQ